MDKDTFSGLVDAVVDEYTDTRGVLVKFGIIYGKQIDLRLCVSSVRNEGLVPSNCILWERDKVIYEGKLTHGRLRLMLEHRGVCCAEFTNTTDLSNGREGWHKCLGNRQGCNRGCSLHDAEDGIIYNPKSVTKSAIAAQERRDRYVPPLPDAPWWLTGGAEDGSDDDKYDQT